MKINYNRNCMLITRNICVGYVFCVDVSLTHKPRSTLFIPSLLLKTLNLSNYVIIRFLKNKMFLLINQLDKRDIETQLSACYFNSIHLIFTSELFHHIYYVLSFFVIKCCQKFISCISHPDICSFNRFHPLHQTS